MENQDRRSKNLLALLLTLYSRKEMPQADITNTLRNEVSNGALFIGLIYKVMEKQGFIQRQKMVSAGKGKANANKVVWISPIQPNVEMVKTILDKTRMLVNKTTSESKKKNDALRKEKQKKMIERNDEREKAQVVSTVNSVEGFVNAINKLKELFEQTTGKKVTISLEIQEKIKLE